MQGHGKKKKREQGDVLTDLVRTVRDRSIEGPQYRTELRRLGILDLLGNAPGEVVAHVLREGEEGGRQEGAEAEVEGHDPAAVVLHELVAVQVTGAEAQTVGLDLGPESGTLFPLRVPENLSQELSSGTSDGARGTRRDEGTGTYAVDMILELLDGIVRYGGLLGEEVVTDRASANGSRRCSRAPDSDEGLHGGGNQRSIGVVAFLPIYVLHDDEALSAYLEGEVDAGDPHGSVSLTVQGFADELLRQGPTHGDGLSRPDQGIGGSAR